ncbi:MAG: polysaccharide deacetylase family protein, partial [Candidatus Binatia bacterium]
MTPSGSAAPRRLPFERPRLIVIVDTEEEFDWSGGFQREATSVSAMDEIGRLQEVCDAFGIRAEYVVDYPVATHGPSARRLGEFRRTNRAEIGAHLHPWVTPPFVEEVSVRNSFPGNLDRDLERSKIESTANAIESSFGIRPRVYKAGRYGIGPNTPDTLVDLGFEVDMSACPAFDFSADGGPDFSGQLAESLWLNDGGRPLLEIPNTAGFVGIVGATSPSLYRLVSRPAMERARVPGILSRLGVIERIMLSPEGHDLDELRRLTVTLFRRGLRVFTFSLHSPSLKPGCTPYVRTAEDRRELLERCRGYFRFFVEELGGHPALPGEVREEL